MVRWGVMPYPAAFSLAFPDFRAQSRTGSCTSSISTDQASSSNPEEKHFVLAGVAVFERTVFHAIKALDDVVDSFGVGQPSRRDRDPRQSHASGKGPNGDLFHAPGA